MSAPELTAHCNCGAVVLELDGPFDDAVYCHCKRCQRRSGTAWSGSGLIAADKVRVVAGEDRLVDWVPEDGMPKTFCSFCGSHIFTARNAGPTLGVRLGIVDGDPGVRPSLHQFVAYAAPWEPIPDDGLPRYDERRPSR